MSSQISGACLMYCWTQMELRDLQSQTKVHERRRPSDMMELVRLEGRSYQVLYATAGASCAITHCMCLRNLVQSPMYFPLRNVHRKHKVSRLWEIVCFFLVRCTASLQNVLLADIFVRQSPPTKNLTQCYLLQRVVCI